MARTLAKLPSGSRISDYISLGVLARRFPRSTVDRVLRQSGSADRRQRDLPAPMMVYYVIALALYMQVSYREVLRCLLEGLSWLQDVHQRPRGASAYPQPRFVSLVENGTHVLFGSRLGPCAESEIALARQLLAALEKDMLCLANRNFFGYPLWKQARGTGADLLWRVKKNLRLPVERRCADGSYLSRICSREQDRRRHIKGIQVRVIEYRLEGAGNAEPLYRLLTSLLDEAAAPTPQLAALCHQRWEIETAWDELKTHLRGSKIVLRSKTPELVRQEFWGLLLAHFAIRDLMQQAAGKGRRDPHRLSYVHAVRVVRRKLAMAVAIPPSG
jgi:hypothetical protein